jgi:hypothetical protein
MDYSRIFMGNHYLHHGFTTYSEQLTILAVDSAYIHVALLPGELGVSNDSARTKIDAWRAKEQTK